LETLFFTLCLSPCHPVELLDARATATSQQSCMPEWHGNDAGR
jgi:hypothetical protein